VQVTKAWFHVPLGRIEPDTEEGRLIQSHSLVLHADLEEEGRFRFPNSWGWHWGDQGFGTFTYDYFDRKVIEAWIAHPFPATGAHTTHEEEFE
jgi:aminopeptidase C